MEHIEIIDDQLLCEVGKQAKASPRLRMNYNFHKSLDEKCHRMLNAVEPGTDIPINRHPTKDETFVILNGRVKVTTYNNTGELQDFAILCKENGLYGVNIPKNVWHTLEALESSMLFECKEGPFVPHEEEGILDISKL